MARAVAALRRCQAAAFERAWHRRSAARQHSRRRSHAAMTVRANQLTALTEAITLVAPLHDPADVVLHHFFRRHPELGRRDRSFVADGVFAFLRRRRSLVRQAESEEPRRLALAVTLREL